MILFLDETGHFTCSQKRTFSLATDTQGLATIHSELAKTVCSLLDERMRLPGHAGLTFGPELVRALTQRR